MNQQEALSNLLDAYTRYYDVRRENVLAPFQAEAEFHNHDSQYFLLRRATISEVNSNEYVYFSIMDHLDTATFNDLDETAWERGLSNVVPDSNHQNSDITLVIVADCIDGEVKSLIKRRKHYRSYKFGLQGWSAYRLVAVELSSGKMVFNHRGNELKKLFCNIFNRV